MMRYDFGGISASGVIYIYIYISLVNIPFYTMRRNKRIGLDIFGMACGFECI